MNNYYNYIICPKCKNIYKIFKDICYPKTVNCNCFTIFTLYRDCVEWKYDEVDCYNTLEMEYFNSNNEAKDFIKNGEFDKYHFLKVQKTRIW